MVWTTRTRGFLIDRPVRSRGVSMGSSAELPGRSPTWAGSRVRQAAQGQPQGEAGGHAGRMPSRCRMGASASRVLGPALPARRGVEVTDLRPGATPHRPVSPAGRGEEGDHGRRRRQDLDVLQVVVRVAEPGPDEHQVVPHLALREHLADLGDELPLLDVPLEELQLLDVLLRGRPVVRPLAVEHVQVGVGDLPRPLQRGRLDPLLAELLRPSRRVPGPSGRPPPATPSRRRSASRGRRTPSPATTSGRR